MPAIGGGGRTLERLEVHRLVVVPLSRVVDEAGLEGVHLVAVLVALVSRNAVAVLGHGRLVVDEGRLFLPLPPPFLGIFIQWCFEISRQ